MDVRKGEEYDDDKIYRHKELSRKSLLPSDALYQYILKTSVYPRQHESVKELRHMTENLPCHRMATPADEGPLLSMLVKQMNAKNAMEIGVLTGCSLLATALALPLRWKGP
ncbi:hypothetical protein PIB30_076655 [Stylosanthes scabra]|uniref:Uncharacterized protein n=1 Tax=Stylosanthes scabra TaxID=79078 RepID=A0ABU6YR28_9FABA|nr:hypothetical protein [Stylosanthes scabra]